MRTGTHFVLFISDKIVAGKTLRIEFSKIDLSIGVARFSELVWDT